jgi:hypothetical protein
LASSSQALLAGSAIRIRQAVHALVVTFVAHLTRARIAGRVAGARAVAGLNSVTECTVLQAIILYIAAGDLVLAGLVGTLLAYPTVRIHKTIHALSSTSRIVADLTVGGAVNATYPILAVDYLSASLDHIAVALSGADSSALVGTIIDALRGATSVVAVLAAVCAIVAVNPVQTSVSTLRAVLDNGTIAACVADGVALVGAGSDALRSASGIVADLAV